MQAFSHAFVVQLAYISSKYIFKNPVLLSLIASSWIRNLNIIGLVMLHRNYNELSYCVTDIKMLQ